MCYKNVQWRMTKVHFKLWCTEVEHYLRAITFLIDLIVSINSDYSHAYPLTGKYSIGLLDNKRNPIQAVIQGADGMPI
jgi:hypothetical protein